MSILFKMRLMSNLALVGGLMELLFMPDLNAASSSPDSKPTPAQGSPLACPTPSSICGKNPVRPPAPATVPPPCIKVPVAATGPARIDLQACSVVLRNPGAMDLMTYQDSNQACKTYQVPRGLLDRIDQHYSYALGCMYQGVRVDSTQTDPNHNGSCVGSSLGPPSTMPTCNLTDGEDQQNHLGGSCGTSTDGSYASSYNKGLSAQILKFYAHQVSTEVANGALVISPNGSCTSLAQDYINQNSCGQCISDNLMQGAGIDSFPYAFFAQQLDFCPSDGTSISSGQVNQNSPNVVPSGMPANYFNVSKAASCLMSGHRNSRIKLFEYLMYCEIEYRIEAFRVLTQSAFATGLPSTNSESGAQAFFKNIVNSSANHYQDVGTPVTLPAFVPTASSTPCPSVQNNQSGATKDGSQDSNLAFLFGLGLVVRSSGSRSERSRTRARRSAKASARCNEMKCGLLLWMVVVACSFMHAGRVLADFVCDPGVAHCNRTVSICNGTKYKNDQTATGVDDGNVSGTYDRDGRSPGIKTSAHHNGSVHVLEAQYCCDTGTTPLTNPFAAPSPDAHSIKKPNPCFIDPTPGCLTDQGQKGYKSIPSSSGVTSPNPGPTEVYDQCLSCNTNYGTDFVCVKPSGTPDVSQQWPPIFKITKGIGEQMLGYSQIGGSGIVPLSTPAPTDAPGFDTMNQSTSGATAGGNSAVSPPGSGPGGSSGPNSRGGRSAGNSAPETSGAASAGGFVSDSPGSPAGSGPLGSNGGVEAGAASGSGSQSVYRSSGGGSFGGGRGLAFGSHDSSVGAGAGATGTQEFGSAASGGDAGVSAILGEDPEDYFTRINLDQDLFKQIHLKYQTKAPSLILELAPIR